MCRGSVPPDSPGSRRRGRQPERPGCRRSRLSSRCPVPAYWTLVHRGSLGTIQVTGLLRPSAAPLGPLMGARQPRELAITSTYRPSPGRMRGHVACYRSWQGCPRARRPDANAQSLPSCPRGGPPPSRGARGFFGRPDHQQDAGRGHHVVEHRRRAYLRLHERGGGRPAHHPDHSEGAMAGGRRRPRSHSVRTARGPLRDRPGGKGRPTRGDVDHGIPDQGFVRARHRCLQDRPRHLGPPPGGDRPGASRRDRRVFRRRHRQQDARRRDHVLEHRRRAHVRLYRIRGSRPAHHPDHPEGAAPRRGRRHRPDPTR